MRAVSGPARWHRTAHAARDGVEVRIRVVFAVDPAHESAVRCRIERALATGHLCGPGVANTEWQLGSCAPAAPTAGENEQVTHQFPDAG
ncbi:hypothetical protein L1080_034660 [Rhodococcus sp. MSC1_016]|jgi:hypothetical protein|uniref:hypothetical protein n=1 Tax=Rhodococcus sp. MSC1_016 TaxID=2909266 RepID=UPI002030C388|nr:hypothetical protein [Rhodococcus sp. MSC1_016]